MPAPRGVKIKGNPASHRMGNPARAARRARNYEAQQKRKDVNRKANKDAAAMNKAQKGLAEIEGTVFYTRWEIAQRNRAFRRKDKQRAYALLHDPLAL